MGLSYFDTLEQKRRHVKKYRKDMIPSRASIDSIMESMENNTRKK